MSHSPRKASSLRTVFCIEDFALELGRELVGGFGGGTETSGCAAVRRRGFVTECVEDARATVVVEGSGIEARPALMPIEVWMQRRKGELCMTSLYFRRFLEAPSVAGESACCSFSLSLSPSRKISPIFCPTALAWFHPLYVRGGSYGVGDWRCHCLLAASSLFPCLWQGAMLASKAFDQELGCRSRRRAAPREGGCGGLLSVRGGDAGLGRQGAGGMVDRNVAYLTTKM